MAKIDLIDLMGDGKFEEVLKITETKNDGVSIFYHIAALSGLGRLEEALEYLKVNRKALEKEDMVLLIRMHFDILFSLEKFDEAYEESKYYQELPYVSQEVEESLRELDAKIRTEERKVLKAKDIKPTEVKKLLSSDNIADVLDGIELARNIPLDETISDIETIADTYPSQLVRSAALLLLCEKKCDTLVSFNHLGRHIKVLPSELIPPFEENVMTKYLTKIQGYLNKDVSLIDIANNILSSYIIVIFPDEIDIQDELLFEAIAALSKMYMKMPVDDIPIDVINKAEDISGLLDSK